jgi:uncharacterized LabA/DUF88 family protein
VEHGVLLLETGNLRKLAILIDGWFMRKRIYRLKSFFFSGDEIRKYCIKHCKNESDCIYRIFYYDTYPLLKTGHHPLTGKFIDFSKTQVAKQQIDLLNSIKKTPNFALRLGTSKWKNNGWILNQVKFKKLIKNEIHLSMLDENDFIPNIEQKAVDMKLGLDIADIASRNLVDLMVVITGDADMVPAFKYARRSGIQIVLDPLRSNIDPSLAEHVDWITSFA